jgi:hypothetical protein
MTQEQNTKVTGFEQRIAEIEKVVAFADDSHHFNTGLWKTKAYRLAVPLVRDMQSALATKDALIDMRFKDGKRLGVIETEAEMNAEIAKWYDLARTRLDDVDRQAAEIAELRGLLEAAAKRSNYVWSENGSYTAQDWKNEGAIELAKTAALAQKGGE